MSMRIAVTSGKGGTGKTTVATSLALSLAGEYDVAFIDCDVEAPNAHIFLQPILTEQQDAVILIPKIDAKVCTLCGKCVEVCQFHALAKIGSSILTFPQLCHGCGSCTWNCPVGAITEVPNPIGVLESGTTPEGIPFSHGVLKISEPMATPIIRQLKRKALSPDDTLTILDSPPGASCSVVETLRGMDFALLVTEPTPFGLHDLKQITGILEEFNIPAGVVINRDGIGDNQTDDFLARQNIPVLMRIPFSLEIAAGLSAGTPLIKIDPALRQDFLNVYAQAAQIVAAAKGGK
ncbi:MAG: ATP-binding protein [Anaerolineaceae bacterium]|nr:ATP-binding protein [Anaerolineaceae bacterium]